MSSPRSTNAKALSFEQATERLEAIVAQLDQPETSLEEMLKLVEEGLGLIKRSRKLLTEAELKIQRLEAPEAIPQATEEAPHRHDDSTFSLL
ncbi:MAG: exodeoxyribonuclease VII small subunit [Akkermansia sp.]